MVENAEETAATHNSRELYKNTKPLAKSIIKMSTPIKSKDGQLLTKTENRRHR